MSLTNALQIGRSGLAASQTALEVVGNNLANAATPGYTRQVPHLVPGNDIEVANGLFLGMGTQVQAIVRATDEALNARLRSAISDREAAATREELLTQVETIYSELTDHGLSRQLDDFFDAWSELANNPTESSLRALVVQEGRSLADYARNIHRDLSDLRQQVDDALRNAVQAADRLLQQIADINAEIVTTERGQDGANSLRDARDQLVKQLSEYVDISTVLQPNGSMDVFIGSIPVVLAGVNRGLDVEYRSQDAGEQTQILLRVASDGTQLHPLAGKIGQLIDSRNSDIGAAVDNLNTFLNQLIFQVNRLHSQGQGLRDFDSLTAAYETDDPAMSMSLEEAGLAFSPSHGSFKIHVTQQSTGTRTTSQIEVDLDGLGGPDMSLNDLAAALDAVDNISAAVTPDGRLQITADSPDFRFSFSDDSSGILAALGLNTFFTGTTGQDIAVNDVLDDGRYLAAALHNNPGSNENALAMAGLQDQPIEALDGLSLRQKWSRIVENLAVDSAAAQQATESQTVIAESLQAQREAVSGVSVDEEAINLLQYQRAYQGAARFITVIDQMMDTLLTLLR